MNCRTLPLQIGSQQDYDSQELIHRLPSALCKLDRTFAFIAYCIHAYYPRVSTEDTNIYFDDTILFWRMLIDGAQRKKKTVYFILLIDGLE